MLDINNYIWGRTGFDAARRAAEASRGSKASEVESKTAVLACENKTSRQFERGHFQVQQKKHGDVLVLTGCSVKVGCESRSCSELSTSKNNKCYKQRS